MTARNPLHQAHAASLAFATALMVSAFTSRAQIEEPEIDFDALIADADEAGRKLDASLDGLKGKSLDEMFRDEVRRIA